MMQSEQNLEASITRALEKKPEAVVPAEFVARVMRSLPPRKQRRKLPVGQTAALTGLLALVLTMFALAPQVTPQITNFAFDLEMLLLVQMAGIGWWFFKADSRQ
jgi:predicted tellurium resistance membrane protein TerC